MTVMHIDPESLAGRVVHHLKTNATETLHSDGISRLFDVSPRVIHTQLADLVAHQALKRDPDPDQGYAYRRGPQFKLVMLDGKTDPVIAPRHLTSTAPPAATAAPKPPAGIALLQEGTAIIPASLKPITPTTVGIRKGIPMPKARSRKATDWGPTLARLTEVGDSPEPLPKRMRSVLARHVTDANRVQGDKAKRFALRAIDDDHFGVWRTA
ncbi:hypothetical protein [Acidovorax sp.]|uniref:hypothetical protein n=1 Tax=Acidovorax sp. TaxID=1872122 RepID=UPI003CFEC96A